MNENIFPRASTVTPEQRRALTGQRAMVLWFTGLSGSGKSTVAAEVEARLVEMGFSAYILDGDNMRTGLNSDLGFSPADRAENIRRLTEAAYLLADSGQIVLVSAISPAKASRAAARKRILSRCDFVEIYVCAPIEICEQRDVKGLYKKARAGVITEFTGVSAPYEAPENPELTLDTAGQSVDECASAVVAEVIRRQFLPAMTEAALCAGKEIMAVYGTDDFKVELKADSSPLTIADKRANAVIVDILKREFPFIPILAEESADDRSRLYSKRCFIVDPLDGTKEFIKRNGEFTVNIALAWSGVPVVGVVYVPITGELYSACRGGGAYRKRSDGEVERLHVSSRMSDLVVMRSRSHGDPREETLLEANKDRIARTVTAGSSLKGCRVAAGEADVYIRFGPTMEWDTAAMQCICEAAGAIVVQTDGTPLTYNRQNPKNEIGFYIINRPENDFINA
jgi:3'(2'), 5'-bisphosphate nucleotidase